MLDKYKNFFELENNEKEGIDFSIEIIDRGNRYAIIAIHGGKIEPATTEIARALAGKDLSFYSFAGNKDTEEESEKLHITSTRFDEPKCLDLVRRSTCAISIHGRFGESDFVMVGGLDDVLITKIMNALQSAGFKTERPAENVNGNSSRNICNKCSSGHGVQLEISRSLRDVFIDHPGDLLLFCNTVRGALVSQ